MRVSATQIFASTFTGNSALCINGGSCSNADGGGLYDQRQQRDLDQRHLPGRMRRAAWAAA